MLHLDTPVSLSHFIHNYVPACMLQFSSSFLKRRLTDGMYYNRVLSMQAVYIQEKGIDVLLHGLAWSTWPLGLTRSEDSSTEHVQL